MMTVREWTRGRIATGAGMVQMVHRRPSVPNGDVVIGPVPYADAAEALREHLVQTFGVDGSIPSFHDLSLAGYFVEAFQFWIDIFDDDDGPSTRDDSLEVRYIP